MHSEYHKWYSPHIHRDMEIKAYGRGGKPVLAFPTQGGKHFDFENFGMISSVADLIDDGKVTLYTVDSIDDESWLNKSSLPDRRVQRHLDYDHYIMEEVVPFIQGRTRPEQLILTAGCSMGGFHAANFFFRRPDVFDSVVSLSGILKLREFMGDYIDDTVYFNSPLYYLPHLTDEWYLERFRKGKIIICVGQGAWEESMLEDARALQMVLLEKRVPCWIDFWGHDVTHDWTWWRKQLPYFFHYLDQTGWFSSCD